jgi:hypothetical protein
MKHILRIDLRAFAFLPLLTALAVPIRAQGVVPAQLLSRTGTNPAVAVDGHGGFVLGWQDVDVPHSSGIFAATLLKGARAPRKPFRVNTTTEGFQLFPDVAADADGRFVLVWQNAPTFPDAPPATSRVFGQSFGAGGGRQSPEIRLSPTEVGQLSPRVAMMDGGDFVAAWVAARSPRPAVKAARFSAGGVRLGSEIDLKSQGVENNLVRVAAVPGGFAVGWSEFFGCPEHDPGGFAAAVARFDSAGRSLGPVFRVGSASCTDTSPVGSLFALVGGQAGALAVFGGSSYYLAQRFDAATGEPTGQFRLLLPACTEGHCTGPVALTMDNSGRFAVIWEADDLNHFSLSAQLFNPRGKPLTARVPVIGATSDSFETPAAALADDGTLAVVWRRNGTTPAESTGLFLRRLVLGGKASE